MAGKSSGWRMKAQLQRGFEFEGLGISDTAGDFGLTTVEMDDAEENSAAKKAEEGEDEEKQNRGKKRNKKAELQFVEKGLADSHF